jgi:chromate reductase
MLRILGIAGSLRKDSYNKAALRAAVSLAPKNVQLEIYNSLADIPPFNSDYENNPPDSVKKLKKMVRDANAILFVTPEYNYSVPGVLKNAIDWVSRPFDDNSWEGKAVAIMGAANGAVGSARAQYHLRQIFVFLNMFTLNRPEVMISFAKQKFDAEGNLIDDETKEKIRQLLLALVDLSEKVTANIKPPFARKNANDLKNRLSLGSQEKPGWCGPTALVYAAYEQEIENIPPQKQIVKAIGTTMKKGTNHEMMVAGSNYLGMKSFWLENTNLAKIQKLKDDGYSIIVNWLDGRNPKEDGHYSLIIKYEDGLVYLQDPDYPGRITIIKSSVFEKDDVWFDTSEKKDYIRSALVLRKDSYNFVGELKPLLR